MFTLRELAKRAVEDWTEFDGEEPVAGADLVEWFGEHRDFLKEALAVKDPENMQGALDELAGMGFRVTVMGSRALFGESAGQITWKVSATMGDLYTDSRSFQVSGSGASIIEAAADALRQAESVTKALGAAA